MKQAVEMENANKKPSGSKEEKNNSPPSATSQEAKTKEIGRILASIGDQLNSRVSPLQADRRKWQSSVNSWKVEISNDKTEQGHNKKFPYASKFSWSWMNFLRSDDKVKNISCAIWMIVLNSCRRLNLVFIYRASGCNNFCNISKHKSNINKTSQEVKKQAIHFSRGTSHVRSHLRILPYEDRE